MTSWFFASTSETSTPQRFAAAASSIMRAAAPTWRIGMKKCRVERAIGVLVAVFGLVPGRLGDFHFCPIRSHFVGDDQRHAGADPLPHLGTMADNGDNSVWRDRNESEGTVERAVRHAAGAPLGRILGQRGTRRHHMHRE